MERMLNTTFNKSSVISWRSVLLVEETEVLRETHRLVGCYRQTLSHYVVSSTPYHELPTLVVIVTDFKGSWKSKYHIITTMTVYAVSVRIALSILLKCLSDFHSKIIIFIACQFILETIKGTYYNIGLCGKI